MEPQRKDLTRYRSVRLALLGILTAGAACLLAFSIQTVISGNGRSWLIGALIGALIATTSARYPVKLPGTSTSFSVSEAITFLAVILLGPYYGALVAVVEMLTASLRLKLRPALCLFNVANHALSIFAAGQAFHQVNAYLSGQVPPYSSGRPLLTFAVPLIALSLTRYGLHVVLLSLMSRLTIGTGIGVTMRRTFPWGPVTSLAGATVAGLVNYAFGEYGLFTTAITLVLVFPVPVIIYYTFKTYHDKLSEQEKHYEEVTNIYDSILEMLAMAIDAKDDVTRDHLQRVKHFARRMGEIVGLTELEIEALKAGALLHDIGKIGVPAYILNKQGKLTEHEFEQMKMHTILGADMLSNIDFHYPVVPIVRHHHERWDGKGYPDALQGDEIPVTARILALVDHYDSLRTERPYKKGLSRAEALECLNQTSGTLFDPALVHLFLSVAEDLEAEAGALQSSAPEIPVKSNRSLLTDAKPAAGLASPPPVDRAAAALHSIAETNQIVAALFEMSRTLASNLSVEDTLAILGNRLSKLVPFSTCAITLFDPHRSEFEIVYAAGLNAERFQKRRAPVSRGITGWVITNQTAMFNTNPILDLGFLGAEIAGEYRTVMVFPLVKNMESLGSIALYSTDLEGYGSQHINFMEAIVQPASDAVHNALAFERAQRAAFTDPLTGLATISAFTMQFDRELARSQRLGTPLSLIVLTIDNMKRSSVSTPAGEENLAAWTARRIKECLRSSDVLTNLSTVEFVALLPDSGEMEVKHVRSRLLKTFADARREQLFEMSLGSATNPGDGSSFDLLLDAARKQCWASREQRLISDGLASVLIAEKSGHPDENG